VHVRLIGTTFDLTRKPGAFWNQSGAFRLHRSCADTVAAGDPIPLLLLLATPGASTVAACVLSQSLPGYQCAAARRRGSATYPDRVNYLATPIFSGGDRQEVMRAGVNGALLRHHVILLTGQAMPRRRVLL
jgi:hypothetical protein